MCATCRFVSFWDTKCYTPHTFPLPSNKWSFRIRGSVPKKYLTRLPIRLNYSPRLHSRTYNSTFYLSRFVKFVCLGGVTSSLLTRRLALSVFSLYLYFTVTSNPLIGECRSRGRWGLHKLTYTRQAVVKLDPYLSQCCHWLSGLCSNSFMRVASQTIKLLYFNRTLRSTVN